MVLGFSHSVYLRGLGTNLSLILILLMEESAVCLAVDVI